MIYTVVDKKKDTLDDLIKKMDNFEKEFILNQLNKLVLGKCNGFILCSVNGDFVKLYPGKVAELHDLKLSKEQIEEFEMEFVEGGNGYRYPFMPKNELWVDDDVERHDYPPIFLHEMDEAIKQRDKKMDYDSAHKESNKDEKIYRLKRLNK